MNDRLVQCVGAPTPPVFAEKRMPQNSDPGNRKTPTTTRKKAEDAPAEALLFPQIASGTVELFRHVDPDDYMWVGSGTREVVAQVTYDRSWSATPHVIVNLVALDASQAHNLRFELLVDVPTKKGFKTVFRTWGDTMIASASVQWTAIGLSAEDRLRSILSK